jgi:hypothetical protein
LTRKYDLYRLFTILLAVYLYDPFISVYCLWNIISANQKFCRYVMGIGEADAFSERLKQELGALEAANVYQLLESEPLIDQVLLVYPFCNIIKFHALMMYCF